MAKWILTAIPRTGTSVMHIPRAGLTSRSEELLGHWGTFVAGPRGRLLGILGRRLCVKVGVGATRPLQTQTDGGDKGAWLTQRRVLQGRKALPHSPRVRNLTLSGHSNFRSR